MPNFDAAIRDSFASAAAGVRRTFVTHDTRNDSFVIRELLYSCEAELFIFAKRLTPEAYSAAVIRNLAARPSPPKIRILLEEAQCSGKAVCNSVFDDLSDLIDPKGPIEIRTVPIASPMHVIVVDAKHVRFDQSAKDNDTIVELNAPSDAQNALKRLNELWSVGQPLKLAAPSFA